MNSIEYLPEFIRDVEEFKQLCLIYDSFGDGAQGNIGELVADETPNTATLAGLQRWAEIQGLTDYENDDIETLRGKVILKFSERVPYTIIKLRQTIESITGSNYFELDMNTPFVVDVRLFSSLMQYVNQIIATCETMLPMNVQYKISPFGRTAGVIHAGGASGYGMTLTVTGTAEM